MPTPPRNPTPRRVNAIALAKFVDLLLDGATIRELIATTGLHDSTVRRYLRSMRAEHVCYIAAWEEDGRGAMTIPVFRIGRDKDVKRKPLSDKERQRRLRQRKKKLKLQQAVLGVTLCKKPEV